MSNLFSNITVEKTFVSYIITAVHSRILSAKLPLDMLDELTHELQAAEMEISRWKAHQLRSVQQEKGKQHILWNLRQSSVLIFMDWAMKFLPRAYHETQAD